ncbi:hypothetical protein C8R44DRAFT_891436 [Mycena epipterygia]|nr:hypothetical protein C8R44DRAFT_891436 [Mycena epipterygia]
MPTLHHQSRPPPRPFATGPSDGQLNVKFKFGGDLDEEMEFKKALTPSDIIPFAVAFQLITRPGRYTVFPPAVCTQRSPAFSGLPPHVLLPISPSQPQLRGHA